MKILKKIIVVGIVVLALGATSVIAFAASNYSTAAEALAGITGRTLESTTNERTETGKSYGAIASEAGKLEEFKKEILEIKKNILAGKVEEGTLTQEEADTILAALEERLANCDGTGGRLGAAGKVSGQGAGQGRGMGRGGVGGGKGMGIGIGEGKCGGNGGRGTDQGGIN